MVLEEVKTEVVSYPCPRYSCKVLRQLYARHACDHSNTNELLTSRSKMSRDMQNRKTRVKQHSRNQAMRKTKLEVNRKTKTSIAQMRIRKTKHFATYPKTSTLAKHTNRNERQQPKRIHNSARYNDYRMKVDADLFLANLIPRETRDSGALSHYAHELPG
jgi:hypothetical protein